MEEGANTEIQGRGPEKERGWLVANKWLTIVTTPSPVFLKVVIPKGFKFLRMNTCRSVDCKRVMGGLSLYKSNCFGPEGSEGPRAGEGQRKE